MAGLVFGHHNELIISSTRQSHALVFTDDTFNNDSIQELLDGYNYEKVPVTVHNLSMIWEP